ncbi:MAG: hypothetical protein V4689_10460 [Verrucomicrobiota bacterium]
MFKKLLDTMESANFKAAAAKGTLACPSCGTNPGVLRSRATDAITCGECGTVASGIEWSVAGSGAHAVANPDRPPAGTKITRYCDASGAVVWNIPASGKSGGLLFFAIAWCTLTVIVSSVFLFGANDFKSSGAFPVELFLILFFAAFWAVGIGMLYAACRSKYARHRLSGDRLQITLHRELFGKTKARSLPAADITSIAQVEFYQKNYQPVHGIEIRGKQGKLRFGSMLTDEEKAWLVADLRRVILEADAPQAVSGGAAVPQPTGMRQEYFSVALPRSGASLRPLAIMLLLMGTGFVCVGIFVLDDQVGPAEKNLPAAIQVFDFLFTFMSQSFRIIWTLMSGVMAAAGMYLLVWLSRARTKETRIEGTASEIAIRTFRHGRILKERLFPRASVTDIRSSVSGSSNGKTMKRVELIVAGKSELVSRWLDGEQADEIVEEVRRAMP